MRVLGISGSLRAGSYNTALLRAAVELAPGDMTVETFGALRDIPLYDEDVRQRGLPPSVQSLRDAIAAADGVLLVTPEYNYSVPGVLKNAIDWASRPPAQPFDGKPIAIMGASPGRLGTARAQYHLRQSFVFLNGIVMPQPEVMVGGADKQVDAAGRLGDEDTRRRIGAFMQAFAEWIGCLQRGRPR
jgi:chromate reductase